MTLRERWGRWLVIAGAVGMVLGSIDPLEGSLLILAGSGLQALGMQFGQVPRALKIFRWATFVLVACGVAALWGLSAVGGFGGPGERSWWWGMLILPYPIGWSMGLWGPGSPRWSTIIGAAVGVFYLSIAGMILSGLAPARIPSPIPMYFLGGLGLITLAGCTWRLSRKPAPLDKSDKQNS